MWAISRGRPIPGTSLSTLLAIPISVRSGTSQIYTVDVADKLVKKLLDSKGPNTRPRWSPDGTQIAFVTANGEQFYFYMNTHIAVIPATGGEPRIVTAKFDEDASLIDWGPDGIYFAAFLKGERACVSRESGKLGDQRISSPDAFFVPDASFTPDHRMFAGIGAAPNHFSEVFVSSAKDFAPKYLTNMSEQWKEFRLTTREVIEWKSTDGTPIQGVLMKPADYDPSRKYPLLVVIHGGPTGFDTPVSAADRYYPIERFAAKGALILRPNYRGSAGYGEKFRSLNVRNLGIGDYQDVISGVDFLIAKGLVDKDRVGAMGWSEGGYISAFITTLQRPVQGCFSGRWHLRLDDLLRQHRYSSVHAPVSESHALGRSGHLSEDLAHFLRQQGQDADADPAWRSGQARSASECVRVVSGLKDRGVPVKLILYKGFGHPINKPKQQRAVMEHNYEWFAKYIWGEEAQSGAVTK